MRKEKKSFTVLERIGSQHKLRAVSAAWLIAAIVISMFSGAYLMAEPWEQNFYADADIKHFYGDEIVLKVGESVAVEVPLGENEKIATIEAADPDVLQVEGTTITAKGQFWTTLTVTTSEIEIPQRPIKQVNIFGWDISEPYDRFRSWLRTLFGIAQPPEQTELRELNTHEIQVNIVGYEKHQGGNISVIRGAKKDDPTELNESENNILHSENNKLVKVLTSQENKHVYEAIATGDTVMHSLIGFWKPASEEKYNEYLEKNPQVALYMESAREACDCSGIAYPHEGMIFVIQRQISYQVKVEEPPKAPQAPRQGGGSGNNSGTQSDTLLGMVNAARASKGLAPMAWSNGLAAAAKIRVNEITELMSHTRPNGEPFYTVNPKIMYGENLAGGIAGTQSVFNAWMNSPGHRANIMNPNFKTIGYANLVINEKYRYYWAMEFGL